jgi:hypothetical protein
MPKLYSYDLGQKVIQGIELHGLKKTEASQMFNISPNTITLWLKGKTETGDFQALPNPPPVMGTKLPMGKNFVSSLPSTAIKPK